MKRIACVILSLFILLSNFIPSYADDTKKAYSQYGENMLGYMKSDYPKLLVLRNNYGYMTCVENFKSNAFGLYLMEMVDKLTGSGAFPNQKKYTEVLVNIISTYEYDNATDLAKQCELDNLKELKDYGMDIGKMGSKMVSILSSNSATSSLEGAISTAIDGVSVLSENTENWINALSDLEVLIQDYAKYDEFLKLIEDEAEGDLKSAASTLRTSVKQAMKIKLETYIDISDNNFENYQEFFFSDVFFSALKNTKEYDTDSNFSFFVDEADEFTSKAGALKESWELGKLIGILVGDVVVGGEDLINRMLEMQAIYDISIILQKELISLQTTFLENYGTESEESLINSYVTMSQYLIGSRIRGEYCIYSIVANDAKLLSWFNKNSAEEAEQWYQKKSDIILTIQSQLLQVFEKEEFINIPYWTIDSEATNRANDKSLSQMFGTALNHYGAELKIDESGNISFYIGAGIGGEGSYSYNGDEILAELPLYEAGDIEELSMRINRQSEDDISIVMDFPDEESSYQIYWIPDNDSDLEKVINEETAFKIVTNYLNEKNFTVLSPDIEYSISPENISRYNEMILVPIYVPSSNSGPLLRLVAVLNPTGGDDEVSICDAYSYGQSESGIGEEFEKFNAFDYLY